ncbi:MAG: hypothetical protein AAF666_01935 [Pseudomonadota bacterium]
MSATAPMAGPAPISATAPMAGPLGRADFFGMAVTTYMGRQNHNTTLKDPENRNWDTVVACAA